MNAELSIINEGMILANVFIFITKSFFFVQVDVKLLVTFIYSFPKLDIRMSAGYRNIYSTERLGCIAIEVKSG